jgi:alpha-amylase/alpha-mannosidase (GH57 family)
MVEKKWHCRPGVSCFIYGKSHNQEKEQPMERYVCIHGHFYQPPRENPWLEEVEVQDSAAPYHDWNERVSAECYTPNAFSRILSADRKISEIVNNYAKISFNFGPTLLAWVEQKQPEVYQRILAADKLSQSYFSGHGSAIAQVYNHIIMSLANSKDKLTQVIWGIRDFVHRFHRQPEGMWLAETAVDIETLEILAAQNIRFTILAPRQARRVKKLVSTKWHDVGGGRIDPRMPYWCRLPSGKTIAIFFYDGYIAQDAAFGSMLQNGEQLALRLNNIFSGTRRPFPLAHIALDGETFGHHQRMGDMTLAYALYYLEKKSLARVTVYGEYLEKHPPTCEVEIWENSSWSCVHGIERWKTNCGCNSGSHPEWTQEWRSPLRGAMDWLRDTLCHVYEEASRNYLKDPWQARNEYIEVILNRAVDNVENFIARHTVRAISAPEKVRLLKLLEMQRCTQLMYTSCGWFFDEISGIETVQILRYAARAMQLALDVGQIELEGAFCQLLAHAPSNIDSFGSGEQVYQMLVKPAVVDTLRVGAHYAISSLFENYGQQKSVKIYGYSISQEYFDRLDLGKQKLALGRALVCSDITGEEANISFAVLHLGDHNLNGGVRIFRGDVAFAAMLSEIKDAFGKNDVPGIIRMMDEHFGTHNYSLWHLFRDEQRKVLDQVFASTLQDMEASLRRIYNDYSPLRQMFQSMHVPLPKPLAAATEFILNQELSNQFYGENLESSRLCKIAAEIEGLSLALDKEPLQLIADRQINVCMEKLAKTPDDAKIMEIVQNFLGIARSLRLQLNLWKAQNIYFAINKEMASAMQPAQADEAALARRVLWKNIGKFLDMKE